MELLADPQVWIALLTLTALEIVLGVDNIVFIAIMAGRLPVHQQARARTIGLMLAMITRILLLFSISLIMRLTRPLFSLFHFDFSGRDLILIGGGLFLLTKATLEIHHSLEGAEEQHDTAKAVASFAAIVAQIVTLDIVFSLDSVITAIGLSEHLPVMAAAIVIAVGVMIFLAAAINDFVARHPTIKILALSFLLLVGLALVGEGMDLHIPKGYIYFAMAFSVFVELINMRIRPAGKPLELRQRLADDD